MFRSEELNSHLKSSYTIEHDHLILAEWNLNESDNLKIVGNYRYRPSDQDSKYNQIAPIFDSVDARNDYTDATYADIVLDGGFDDEDNPIFFTPRNKKMELLYSLEDCLKPFRPRSGINKLLYLSTISAPPGYNQYVDSLSRYVARRPRYYMSSKFDQFKYWTSYRTEPVETEVGLESREYGVSENDVVGDYFISDAAPFAIYKSAVPANRLVVKMQTNVGEENLGPYRVGFDTSVADPLFGEENRTVPKQWRVQVLKDNTWFDVISFRPDSRRDDGSPIVRADGHVELEYGMNIPENYRDIFVLAGYLTTEDALSDFAPLGYSYLVREDENDRGMIYIYDGGNSIPEHPGWSSFQPTYSWSLGEDEVTRSTKIAKKVADPEYFISNGQTTFREFDFIEGIRVVAEKMNKPNITFDLIEMSPRLIVDLSEMTLDFSVNRTLSDLGNNSVPVGSLLASSGTLNLFDSDFVFNENNSFDPEKRTGSVVANRRLSQIKFKFYEIVKNVDRFDYYIPIKTMYSEGLPTSSDGSTSIQITMRDFYFYFESEKAPEMLLTDVSLSYAITVLLDNVGFSNYVFKRNEGEDEFIIPYFFVGPEQNLVEVLQDLATSTQSAMFFDEYNNFVVMSKDYILPSEGQRKPEVAFYGHQEEFEINPGLAKIESNYATIQTDRKHYLSPGDKVILSNFDIPVNGEYSIDTSTENTFSFDVDSTEDSISQVGGNVVSKNLPNIVNLASQEKKIFNNGKVDYTTRYIQRSIGKFAQAYYHSEGQNFIYKPVLLWEVAPVEALTSVNELPAQSGGYYLAASPLRTSLSSNIPSVESGEVVDNIIDLGENVYWLTSKYAGYLYANAEIIKYDAIEYAVQGVGTVWISNNHQYQDYFSKLQFNGKMYPTGNVRIYAEPEYISVDGITKLKEGPVKKHGRGQFGTNVVFHSAGLTEDLYWTDSNNVRGMIQDSKKYVFTTNNNIEFPANLGPGVAGKSKTSTLVSINADEYSKNSTRNGVIKNFLSDKNLTEKETSYFKTANSGTIQTSALVFGGPEVPDQIDSSDFVSYVYKDLSSVIPPQTSAAPEIGIQETNQNTQYTHFGTRMRILGKIESGTNRTQSPIGAYEIFNSNQASSANPEDIVTFSGGSGGIAFNLNKDTNNGYYFEIVALTSDQIKNYRSNGNVTQYKIERGTIVVVEEDVIKNIPTNVQHSYNVGDKVLISGMIDKNRTSNGKTTLNGEHTVVAVSEDRKFFDAQITAPQSMSQSIVSATSDSQVMTYRTARKIFSPGQLINIQGSTNFSYNSEEGVPFVIDSAISSPLQETVVSAQKVVSPEITFARYTTSGLHKFVVGQKVDISSMAPEDFNLKGVEVIGVGSNTFEVIYPSAGPTSSTKGGRVFGIEETFTVKKQGVSGTSTGGTATYVKLNTESDSGGRVTRAKQDDFNVANVFFYKVLAGSNISQVVRKQKDALTGFVANQATITTLQPHSFNIGDVIEVNIDDTEFDGTFTINNTSEFTITYTTENIAVVPLTDISVPGTVSGVEKLAIPQVLWNGYAEINLDDGLFATEARFNNNEQTTIYDLSAEYVEVDDALRFYLYLNGKQIATVDDTEPLEIYNNLALFVRGSSRCMFENVYALGRNKTENLFYPPTAPIIQSGFGDLNKRNTSEVIKRYGMSDIIKNTYCSGISSQEPPKFNMYFEEFGTIMREVAYFNVKYDRAYPALYAKLAPVINDVKAYNVSGFYAGAYGAEFLIFNNMDKTINLDDTTGNYLRIYGIAFTQDTTRSLTIDEYLEKVGNLADPKIEDGTVLYNPLVYKEIYDQVKQSRLRYGNVDFAIQSTFIQTSAAAEEMLDWIIKKTYQPKKAVGIEVFGTSNVQLGDIATINYRNSDGKYVLGDPETRYIVYNIEYSKSSDSKSMTVYLVEV